MKKDTFIYWLLITLLSIFGIALFVFLPSEKAIFIFEVNNILFAIYIVSVHYIMTVSYKRKLDKFYLLNFFFIILSGIVMCYINNRVWLKEQYYDSTTRQIIMFELASILFFSTSFFISTVLYEQIRRSKLFTKYL